MEKRNTVQKTLVYQAVHALASHPTAEEVYDSLHAAHPSISKATIYRNLSSLAQDGRLRHVRMADGADRFDHDLTEHQHISCRVCGAFADTPRASIEEMDARVGQATGYGGVTHDIVFTGVCPKCQKKS